MKVSLKTLGQIVTGNTPSKSNPEYWHSDDISFVKPDILPDNKVADVWKTKECISEAARSKSRIVGENAIFVTCIGSIGKIGIATKGEFAFNQQINAIIPNSKVFPKYLAYVLLNAKPRLTVMANAPVVPIINKSQFGDFQIDISENYEEQKRISAILDSIESIITQQNQALYLLDKLVKSRFVEMFGLPGTDVHGWGMSSLGEICEINPKKSQDARLTNGLLVSFVPMPSVSESGDIDATQVKPYDEVKTGFTYFAENDVLFAKITPCMENGKGAIATGLYNGIGFGSTEFHVLRPAKETATPRWIYTLTVFPQFRIDAASNMTGSAGQRRVPASFLENYRVSVPPLELQNRFAAFVTEVDKSKLAVKQSLEKLETLKKSLMQQYFG